MFLQSRCKFMWLEQVPSGMHAATHRRFQLQVADSSACRAHPQPPTHQSTLLLIRGLMFWPVTHIVFWDW
jgi:hypothetical protein